MGLSSCLTVDSALLQSIEGCFNLLQTKKQAKRLERLYAKLMFSDRGKLINNWTLRLAIN